MVNGMRELAGLVDHAQAHAPGRLSGARWCGMPGSHSRGLTFSSISPRLTLTGLQPRHVVARQHAGVGVRQEPALERARARPTRGSRPCSSWPSVASVAAVRRERALGLVAEAEQRLDAALRARARRATSRTSSWRHRPRARVARRAPERAVVAAVAAEVGERQEHLGRERDGAPIAAVAHVARALHELRDASPWASAHRVLGGRAEVDADVEADVDEGLCGRHGR